MPACRVRCRHRVRAPVRRESMSGREERGFARCCEPLWPGHVADRTRTQFIPLVYLPLTTCVRGVVAQIAVRLCFAGIESADRWQNCAACGPSGRTTRLREDSTMVARTERSFCRLCMG